MNRDSSGGEPIDYFLPKQDTEKAEYYMSLVNTPLEPAFVNSPSDWDNPRKAVSITLQEVEELKEMCEDHDSIGAIFNQLLDKGFLKVYVRF